MHQVGLHGQGISQYASPGGDVAVQGPHTDIEQPPGTSPHTCATARWRPTVASSHSIRCLSAWPSSPWCSESLRGS
jgi:hypothetical protein